MSRCRPALNKNNTRLRTKRSTPFQDCTRRCSHWKRRLRDASWFQEIVIRLSWYCSFWLAMNFPSPLPCVSANGPCNKRKSEITANAWWYNSRSQSSLKHASSLRKRLLNFLWIRCRGEAIATWRQRVRSSQKGAKCCREESHPILAEEFISLTVSLSIFELLLRNATEFCHCLFIALPKLINQRTPEPFYYDSTFQRTSWRLAIEMQRSLTLYNLSWTGGSIGEFCRGANAQRKFEDARPWRQLEGDTPGNWQITNGRDLAGPKGS